jgi:hypothetical protein
MEKLLICDEKIKFYHRYTKPPKLTEEKWLSVRAGKQWPEEREPLSEPVFCSLSSPDTILLAPTRVSFSGLNEDGD